MKHSVYEAPSMVRAHRQLVAGLLVGCSLFWASPASAGGDRQAWRDCMTACILFAFWGPGVAAWAAGCTLGYVVDSAIPNEGAVRFDPDLGYRAGQGPAASSETIALPSPKSPDRVVTLRAGRFDPVAGQFLPGQGNVTSAQFYAVEFSDLFAAADFDSAPWVFLGQGSFDSQRSMWTISWDTASFPVTLGYALRVDLNDSSLGTRLGLNAAGIIPETALDIPSLSPWGVLLLAGLLLLLGLRFIRTTKRQPPHGVA